MASKLSIIFPPARLARVGGDVFFIDELKIGDLAKLQGWLDDRCKSDYESARPELTAMAPGERYDRVRAILVADRESADAGLYGVHPDTFNDEGIVIFLLVVLKVDLDRAREVAGAITVDELVTLHRAAYRPSARAEMLGIVFPPLAGEGGDGESRDWAGDVWKVIERTGWTFDQIQNLTISQFRMVLCHGEIPSGELPDVLPNDGESQSQAAIRMSAEYRESYIRNHNYVER